MDYQMYLISDLKNYSVLTRSTGRRMKVLEAWEWKLVKVNTFGSSKTYFIYVMLRSNGSIFISYLLFFLTLSLWCISLFVYYFLQVRVMAK